MHAVYGLRLSSWVELRFHHEDFVGGREVEAETAGANRNEHDANVGVVAQRGHGFVACVARHAPVEADEGVARGFEGDFDKIEMCGPRGEDDARVGMLVD